jgi:hypothetical protein
MASGHDLPAADDFGREVTFDRMIGERNEAEARLQELGTALEWCL